MKNLNYEIEKGKIEGLREIFIELGDFESVNICDFLSNYFDGNLMDDKFANINGEKLNDFIYNIREISDDYEDIISEIVDLIEFER